ncbi:MAG: nucleoside triphosphate pyrophosphohydrolase [Chitinivibrionales bacterium]|nr:nucleoside triphosphate pyrophosphohydrolase [Chitinivibrionales bacterium]MBD3355951.1 nucleoside triphosphate pyrophosphohydrolase [Chitinivibrionales bacterium]
MGKDLDRLVEIVARLRGPGGCPWDREQTHESLLPCLLEEAYEFIEAAEKNDAYMMREELGDLLLQVVLHCRMAEEEGRFTFEEVAQEIGNKLVRRHPHVFGEENIDTAEEVIDRWEKIKREEKGKEDRLSVLDGIASALPSLLRAEKLQRRAARAGFDWDRLGPVLDKVEEEFGEFRAALEQGDRDHAEDELGDIIFALVNVARHNDIVADSALRRTNSKFSRRFRFVEKKFQKLGRPLEEATLEELDEVWEECKREERGSL